MSTHGCWRDVSLCFSAGVNYNRPWSSSRLLDTPQCHLALSIFIGPACHLWLGQIHGRGISYFCKLGSGNSGVVFSPKLTAAWFGTGNGCFVRGVLCVRVRTEKAETRTTGLCVRWATVRRSHRKYFFVSSIKVDETPLAAALPVNFSTLTLDNLF